MQFQHTKLCNFSIWNHAISVPKTVQFQHTKPCNFSTQNCAISAHKTMQFQHTKPCNFSTQNHAISAHKTMQFQHTKPCNYSTQNHAISAHKVSGQNSSLPPSPSLHHGTHVPPDISAWPIAWTNWPPLLHTARHQPARGARHLLCLQWFVECSDDMWWECSFCKHSEESVARHRKRKAPHCAGEHLQRTEDIAK